MLKSSLKDNPKIPDILFSAPVSPLNPTLYTGRTVSCYELFHVLINKLFELNEVLIHLFVTVSLRINAIVTQYVLCFSQKELICSLRSPNANLTRDDSFQIYSHAENTP